METAVLLFEKSACEELQTKNLPPVNEIPVGSIKLICAVDEESIDQKLFDRAADPGWLKRRIDYVHEILAMIILFFPDPFKNCTPTLTSFGMIFGNEEILIRLRSIAESRIHEIPKPVGLNPRYPYLQDMGSKPP